MQRNRLQPEPDTRAADASTALVERLVEGDLLGPDVLFGEVELRAPAKYELLRPIGRGGAGVVWLAHDASLAREVALKFLIESGPAELERFRREARFTARLDLPSIVRVHELGDEDGLAYIAMEYIDGANLREAELDQAGVLRVVREVASALAHAHAAGVVHRDIKPENILVDRHGRAHLTDFGIARDLYGRHGDTLSVDGQIMGTPGLMSPEQARGENHAVDARSDVYALGATLFAKLAGRPPFGGRNVVDVLHAVIHEPAPLLRSFVADAPSGLEALVDRCLQKARSRRHPSMQALVQDLDRVLAGASDASASSAWFKRLVTAVVGVPDRGDAGADDAGADDAAADDAAADDTRALAETIRELATFDANLYRVSGSLERAFAQLDASIDRLERLLLRRPDAAWARFYRGVALARRGRTRAALEEMERSIDGVRDRAGAYFELGRLYLVLHLEDQREARKHINAIGTRHELLAAEKRLDQAALAFEQAQQLGVLLPWQRDFAAAARRLAQSDFQACVAGCDRILAAEADLEEVWRLRGDALRLAGQDPIESYERALDVRRSDYTTLFAMAEVYVERGDLARARELLERACTIHPRYADAWSLRARACLIDARAPEARGGDHDALLEAGVEVGRQALALEPEHYETTLLLAEAQGELARRRAADAGFVEALATLDGARALRGCQNRVNLMRARTLLERGRLARAGDPQACRAWLEEARALGRAATAVLADQPPWQALLREVEHDLGRR